MSLGDAFARNPVARLPMAPPKRSAPVGIRARVELVVLAAAGEPAPMGPEKRRFQLAPGNTFSVRVLLRPAGLEETDAVEFLEGEPLSLSWQGPEGLLVQPEAVRAVPADLGQRVVTWEFSLSTEPGSKGKEGQLLLSRSSRGNQVVRSLDLRVEEPAAGFVMPQAVRDKSLVDLELSPANPEATAFLHVEASDATLRLHWFPSKALSTQPLEILEPPLNLMDNEGKPNTAEILTTVQDFFRQQCLPLKLWLQERVKARSEVTLIIQEQAESRVPWEMLELPFRKGSRILQTPIGALIKVVRWLMAHDVEEGPLRLKLERQTWTGQAMAYVAEKELAHAKRELDALKGCHEPFKDIGLFQKTLEKRDKPPALVFVASHGPPRKGVLASQSSESPLTLLMRGPPAFAREVRALAFINACHSGLLVRGAFGISGLPEKLLSSFAGAYLGVLGAVGDEVAASVGERILNEARKKEGVCIPEFLRELRKEAFKNLDTDKNTSRVEYVYKFMYVFYGTPEAYLKLEPARAAHG